MINLESSVRISGQLKTSRDGGDAVFDIDERARQDVDNGTTIGKANAIYVDDFSIPASSTLALDLSGSLEDAHGNPLVFTAIKEILIVTAAGNVNNVVVGNGGANSFLGPLGAIAHTVTLLPNNRLNVSNYSAAGWPVVAATGDILQLANSGAGSAVTGTIVIVGVTA